MASLQSWVEGTEPKRRPPAHWDVYAPPRGAAFFYPSAWSVSGISDPDIYDLADGNPFGAIVASPDETAVVLMMNYVANEPIGGRDAAWQHLHDFHQARRLTEMAEEEYGLGFGVSAAFAAASRNDVVAATVVQTTPDTVTGGSYVYVLLVGAAAEDFDALTDDVFLPMLQNLVTDGGSECDTDSDDDYPLDDCPSVSNR